MYQDSLRNVSESVLIYGPIIIDAIITGIFEVLYLLRINKVAEYFKYLRSTVFFQIMPAAIAAGPFGLVPFAIASRFSVQAAASLSSFYPVFVAVFSLLIFKERIPPLKWIGITLGVMGITIISGFSGIQAAGVAWGLLSAAGYAMELIIGYRLMKKNVAPEVTLVLKQTAVILLYTAILVMLILYPENLKGVLSLVKLIDFNPAYGFTNPVRGNRAAIALVFILASLFNATTYTFYFKAICRVGVSTASALNITYGLWTMVILALPPFLTPTSMVSFLGAALTLTGAAIVIKVE